MVDVICLRVIPYARQNAMETSSHRVNSGNGLKAKNYSFALKISIVRESISGRVTSLPEIAVYLLIPADLPPASTLSPSGNRLPS